MEKKNIYEELETLFKSIESDIDLLDTVNAIQMSKENLLICFREKLIEIKINIVGAVRGSLIQKLELETDKTDELETH